MYEGFDVRDNREKIFHWSFNVLILDICSCVYLCVIQESDSSVTWPERNISHPACAIIAPLSIQNLRFNTKRLKTTDSECCEFFQQCFLPLICGKKSSISLLTHDPHHLLQAQVTCKKKSACLDADKTAIQRPSLCYETNVKKPRTADSTDDQNLLRAAVSHGSFCGLHQHSEHSLLSITLCLVIFHNHKVLLEA